MLGFTNNTQTFYEPYIETKYDNHIIDDRNNFILDKLNKLYLYVNVGGNPTNLDALPTVIINGDSLLTPQVNHITKGVYSVDVLVSSLSGMVNTIWTDEWSGIIINGVNRPNITLDFVLKDSIEYYSLGSADLLPKKVAISVGGLHNKERLNVVIFVK
jgi:hypothetical protein